MFVRSWWVEQADQNALKAAKTTKTYHFKSSFVMDPQFTDEAREAVRLAEKEAKQLSHEYVGTEHLLLGLVRDSSGVVAKVLSSFGIDFPMILAEVENIVGVASHSTPFGKLPYSPRAKMIFEDAVELSRNLHQNLVGPEHLLIGLVRERAGVACRVLKNLGVRNYSLLRKTLDLLNATAESSASIEEDQEELDTATYIEELPTGERIEWTLGVRSCPLVRMAYENGFSMEATAKLAQRWHQEYVTLYGHKWSNDWDEQVALSFQGENGPALQPGINEKWFPWWEKLIQQLGKDGVFENSDRPEKWQISE